MFKIASEPEPLSNTQINLAECSCDVVHISKSSHNLCGNTKKSTNIDYSRFNI